MIRLLLTGALLALAACAATPSGGTAAGPLPGGQQWPVPPRARAPSSERPPWLPVLPEHIERYPEPDQWRRAGVAGLLVPRDDRGEAHA
jgi:hypothetical protein